MNLLLQFFIFLLLLSQPTFQKNQSSIKVLGDSSMHEWEMVLEDYTIEHKWEGDVLVYIKLHCKANALKSGKEKMDENAMEAMEADKFPSIYFESSKVEYHQEGSIKASGTLRIRDVSRESFYTGSISKKNGVINIQGSQQLNMEDFGIEAPTAMFVMKVDPELVIKYDLKFKP